MPRARVLIEDPELVLPGRVAPWSAVDVVTCCGPVPGAPCPLVEGDPCPFGPVDVVVSALEGTAGADVRAAWRLAGTPLVDAPAGVDADPERRVERHVAAGLRRLWA